MWYHTVDSYVTLPAYYFRIALYLLPEKLQVLKFCVYFVFAHRLTYRSRQVVYSLFKF